MEVPWKGEKDGKKKRNQKIWTVEGGGKGSKESDEKQKGGKNDAKDTY